MKIGWFGPIPGGSDRESWPIGTGLTMYAIIKTGGKQYKVAEKDTIQLERLAGEAGDTVAFGEVLMVGGDDGVTLGSPLVSGAQVAGEIVEHRRSATILVFKKRRRQNSKRSRGHRQHHTVVRITEILTDGKEPAKKVKAEAAAPEMKADKPKRAAPKKAAAEAKPKAAPRKRVKPATKE
jgi:large subunit ribosomal protein L21